MNKPAPKEPSMDEILSSIRQIIADDDAAGSPKKPAGLGASPLVSPAPPIRPALAPRPVAPAPEPEPEPEAEAEPLALSAEQIVETPAAPTKALSFDEIMGGSAKVTQPSAFAGEPQLVDPEDVAFAPDPEPEAELEDEPEDDPLAMFSVEVDDEPEMPAPAPAPVAARPTYVPPPMPRPAPRPQPSVAQTAPMPDPQLSSDMAEQLLDQTTHSAVRSTFNKLNGLSMAGSGVTLEAMMRDMLRPMLKEWLDENLPAVVERMVEREIARISRGGE